LAGNLFRPDRRPPPRFQSKLTPLITLVWLSKGYSRVRHTRVGRTLEYATCAPDMPATNDIVYGTQLFVNMLLHTVLHMVLIMTFEYDTEHHTIQGFL